MLNYRAYRKIYHLSTEQHRSVYIVPQEHFIQAYPPSTEGTFRRKLFVYLYHRYARDVRERLIKDHVSPYECIIYHEGTVTDQSPEDLKRVFTGESMINNFPHELSTTFVAPLLKEGAGICGVEERRWVNGGPLSIRDHSIALFVQRHLPYDKVGIIVIGAGHNVEHPLKVYNQVEIRTTRDLFNRYSCFRKIDNFLSRPVS